MVWHGSDGWIDEYHQLVPQMLCIPRFSSNTLNVLLLLYKSKVPNHVCQVLRVSKAIGLKFANPPHFIVYLNMMPTTPHAVRHKNESSFAKGR
jgi:hypothetical protein